jgi:hypothetical protein
MYGKGESLIIDLHGEVLNYYLRDDFLILNKVWLLLSIKAKKFL